MAVIVTATTYPLVMGAMLLARDINGTSTNTPSHEIIVPGDTGYSNLVGVAEKELKDANLTVNELKIFVGPPNTEQAEITRIRNLHLTDFLIAGFLDDFNVET